VGILLARPAALQSRLHDLVPGGAHTFAKASDQYPEGMAPVATMERQGRLLADADVEQTVEAARGATVACRKAWRPASRRDSSRAAQWRRRTGASPLPANSSTDGPVDPNATVQLQPVRRPAPGETVEVPQ
jgi:hypothetical protein